LKLKKTTIPRGDSDSMVVDYTTMEDEKEYKKKGSISWYHYLIDGGLCCSEECFKFIYYKYNFLDNYEIETDITEFNFLNFSDVLKAFSIVHEDLLSINNSEKDLYQKLILEKRNDIELLKNRIYIDYFDPYFGISNKVLREDFLNDIKKLKKELNDTEIIYQKNVIKSYEYQGKLEKIYQNIFDNCIQNHGYLGTFYQRGLMNFNNGNILNALNDIDSFLKQSKDNKDLEYQIILLKGQSEVELGLYHDAIVTLSKAIKNDSKNKSIYFDRAQAYFELGNFDLALKDFILSDFKVTHIEEKNVSVLNFSKGLISGIIKGGKDGAIEFVPSALASLNGLGHGLWAFAISPLECSKEMISSCQNCIKLIKENNSVDILKELVPELKTLINDWDNLNDEKKGDLTGYVIGKYGVDIFMTSGSMKAIKYYRDLKAANAALTFEKTAKSFKNSEIILKEASQKYAQREAAVKNANLKIQWDKQGKHIIGHNNYIKEQGKSIFTHKNPQKLIDKFAGTGLKSNQKIIGQPGFAEIIDFGETIGYDIDRFTEKKVKTSWGKIHYAKDGVHIVPTKPR
jgi:tetratricopeptide (TPR) repeat protein